MFDDKCQNYDEYSLFNEVLFKKTQNMLSDRLQYFGVVLLKDFYDILGFDTTKESCTFGWVKGVDDGGIKMDFHQLIDNPSKYLITFECYPIIEHLKSEENVAE